jgi:hypothetical protein
MRDYAAWKRLLGGAAIAGAVWTATGCTADVRASSSGEAEIDPEADPPVDSTPVTTPDEEIRANDQQKRERAEAARSACLRTAFKINGTWRVAFNKPEAWSFLDWGTASSPFGSGRMMRLEFIAGGVTAYYTITPDQVRWTGMYYKIVKNGDTYQLLIDSQYTDNPTGTWAKYNLGYGYSGTPTDIAGKYLTDLSDLLAPDQVMKLLQWNIPQSTSKGC